MTLLFTISSVSDRICTVRGAFNIVTRVLSLRDRRAIYGNARP